MDVSQLDHGYGTVRGLPTRDGPHMEVLYETVQIGRLVHTWAKLGQDAPALDDGDLNVSVARYHEVRVGSGI